MSIGSERDPRGSPGEDEGWLSYGSGRAPEAHYAERDYEPIHPEPAWRGLARKLLLPVVALGALIWKLKFVLVAIFKLKLFSVAGSMLVSIAAYAWIWGWKFAVGLVLLLFVHELGHVLEARRQGLPVSAPLFIPFMGALITMKQMPPNVWREAQVALAGPIVGSAGAAVLWALGDAYDSELLVGLAFVGFFLNLLNLLPLVPLDGGRAIAALHPVFWILGLGAALALAIVRPNPVLIAILVLGGFELWERWTHIRGGAAGGYYVIEPWQRVAVGVVYLGLGVVLALAMSATHVEKDF